jgi:hypothetical protein
MMFNDLRREQSSDPLVVDRFETLDAGCGGPNEAAESASEALNVGLTKPVSLDMLAIGVPGLIAGAFAASRAAPLRPADAVRRVACSSSLKR